MPVLICQEGGDLLKLWGKSQEPEHWRGDSEDV